MNGKPLVHQSLTPAQQLQPTTPSVLQRAAIRTSEQPEQAADTVSTQGSNFSPDFSQIPVRANPDRTGLPPRLRAGVEQLSGLSMADVRVHYNSSKPAQVGALAYTQGSAIHLAAGQERHLPHEAWHVVQQMQRQVQPTARVQGIALNDDPVLERDAEAMGAKALSQSENGQKARNQMHQVEATLQTSAAVVQKVDDPGETIFATLRAAYTKLYKKYNLLSSIPKPGQVTKQIRGIISKAKDEDDAYAEFAVLVAEYFRGQADDFIKSLKQEIRELATNKKDATIKEQAGRKLELEKLQQLEQESSQANKRQRSASGKNSIKNYSHEQQTALDKKLKDVKVQQKLADASFRAYQAHVSKSRPTVQGLASLNALAEDPNAPPLSFADMAMAQGSYKKERIGDPLLLEKSEGHKVTMARGGGQIVQQLGPYLPGDKPSVQEIITEVLENTKLTSPELAEAINIRDPKELKKWLEGKEVSPGYFEKIRAMRHLLAIEQSRGPEVAVATSLEHRSAVHSFSLMKAYPENTPLGPPKATTNIKTARKKQLAREGKQKGERPSNFDYIPPETQRRAAASTSHFLTNFAKTPKLDPEASALVEAILNEDEADQPSELLVAAMEGILRTPTYTGFGSEDYEQTEKPEDPFSIFGGDKSEKLEDFSSAFESGKSEKLEDFSLGLAAKGGGVSFVAPLDPMAPSIDHIDVFSEFAPDLRSDVTRLEPYEAGAVLKLLGPNPAGMRVNLGGVTYTVLVGTEKVIPTDYNPKGLVLGFKVYHRGG